MSIKRLATSLSDKITSKVDDKMMQYIDNFILEDMTDLEKAITIYLRLGDILRYDTLFTLTQNYNRTNMVRDITPANTEMICKSWAILYSRILKKYGIKAKADRFRAHYKVQLTIDDIKYNVDSTIYRGSDYHTGMSDTTRLKFGFKINQFQVDSLLGIENLELYKEAVENLERTIDQVYANQGRKVITDERIIRIRKKSMDLAMKHGEKVGVGTPEDIEFRIKLINRFWQLNINDQGVVEKIQLFNAFSSAIFADYQDYEYTYKCNNIYAYKNKKLRIYKLLSIEIMGKYYYYMDDGKTFSQYTKQGILDEIENRNARISEFTEIPGIYVGLELYRIKVK